MFKEIFPKELAELLTLRFNLSGIYELRIRTEKPLYVNYFGEYLPLRDKSQSVVYADKRLIEYVVEHITENSVYRYNSQIKKGFITTQDGIRVGLAGEIVEDAEQGVKTIKNLTSMVIRVPHEIKNCASDILPFIVDSAGVKNTLIISPPGCGKTTMIRDLSRSLSFMDKVYNILVVDERYEIAGAESGVPRMDIGLTADVISGGTKEFSFNSGIRTLKPDVIITDEIGAKTDAVAIRQAILSGVKVIATAHASAVQELRKRNIFYEMFHDKVFDRYVVLSNAKGIGTIESILNSNFEQMV